MLDKDFETSSLLRRHAKTLFKRDKRRAST